MVYMNNDEKEAAVEITDDEDPQLDDTEVVEVEENSKDKIKKLRDKLARCEEEKKQANDDVQRARADFLNARKRLEDERARDKIRHQIQHVEELLPLCDSFQMAMSNKEAWEKADPAWRKGIEGIHAQLLQLLTTYQVTVIDPRGMPFDPHRDEAVGTEVVEDKKQVDTVVSVIQQGYEIRTGDTTEIIRHPRVTTGVMKN